MTNGSTRFVVASRRAPCSPGIHFIVRLRIGIGTRILKLLEIGLAYIQIINNLTSQAATMVTHGIPNDIINNLDPIALIIFIPICDLLVYPGLRRIGINFTPIKRITAGFLAGSAAMVWAAVVQHYIYKVGSTTFNDVDSE
jgi:POT family